MPLSTGIISSSHLPSPTTTNMALWLDSADTSTLTFSSGNIVSQWNDKSGNGRNFSQPTTSAQPIRNTTQNGLPTLNFDGVDDCLVSNNAASTWTFLHNGTVSFAYCVARYTGAASTSRRILTTVPYGASSEIGISMLAGMTATDDVRFTSVFNGSGTNYIYSLDQPIVAGTQRYISSGTEFDLNNATTLFKLVGYINLANISFATESGTWSGPSSANPSSTMYIGGSSVNYEPFLGQIAEIIIYNGALTSRQEDNIRGYLVKKWGLQRG